MIHDLLDDLNITNASLSPIRDATSRRMDLVSRPLPPFPNHRASTSPHRPSISKTAVEGTKQTKSHPALSIIEDASNRRLSQEMTLRRLNSAKHSRTTALTRRQEVQRNDYCRRPIGVAPDQLLHQHCVLVVVCII